MNKIQLVKSFFDAKENYLDANPLIEFRKNILQDLLGNTQMMKIIDVGCGNGELTKDYTSKNKVTFLDISENMLLLAKENIPKVYLSNGTFINADFLQYIPDNKFDIAVCFGVVAHTENVLTLIKKLNEVTTNNGKIILQYSDADKILSKINRFRYKLLARSKYNYKINLTTFSEVKKFLDEEELIIVKKVVHIPVSPILSVFSYKKKLELLLNSYRSKKSSFINSEVILYLSKASSK